MNDPFPVPRDNHPIDRIVRSHLLAVAGTVDADGIVNRLRDSFGPTPSPSTALPRRETGARTVHRLAWFAGGLAVAACLTLALVFVPSPRTASAAEWLASAKSAHESGPDRRYELIVEVETGAARLLDLPPLVRRSSVWTRGDQFWIETQPPKPDLPPLAWGQDATGRVWVAAPSRTFGVVYEPDEINEPIATACDLMSLRTVTLLGELLADFDLARRDSRPGDPVRIEAVFRPSPGARPRLVRDVQLDVDLETKAIRKAVLRRNAPGPLGGRHALTLTFTLAETGDLDPTRYSLVGHLDPGAKVLDRREPNRGPRAQFREEMMKRFGERMVKP